MRMVSMIGQKLLQSNKRYPKDNVFYFSDVSLSSVCNVTMS